MTTPQLSIRRMRPLLGTFVEIAVAGVRPDAAEAAVEAAFSAVATVHRLMSFHDTDSDLSRLNRGAAVHAVKVDERTYQVLEAARDLYRRSGGMFDISVARAPQRRGLLAAVPDLSTRSRADSTQKAPAHDRIQLLPLNRVRFVDASVKIDLGGIAKGFAVDCAVEALRVHGVAEGLVNAGGDLRGFGPRSHMIDIRDPRQPERPLCRVALANAALASSGGRFDPLRSRQARCSAVIDPVTAMPPQSVIGATVRAGSCVIADALTKVVMNGAEAAAPTLEHYGADALFISGNVVHMTANWKNEVRLAA